MFVKIDWVSFSYSMEVVQSAMAFEVWGRASACLFEQYPLAAQMLVNGHEFVPKAGRAPYNASQHRDDGGVVIFAHQRLNHSLVEIGGIGCDALGSQEAALALVQEVAPTITRLDIAVDIYCETSPADFAAHRTGNKFSAWSEAVSGSGHTVYIGSKSSDRYARVYRYYDPHPRARFLRVEHVLKSEQAKLTAQALKEKSLDTIVAQLGNTFGWKHPDWQPSVNTEEAIAAWRPERRQGKTVAWVHSVVIPLLARLHKERVLDIMDVWRELRNATLTEPEQ